MDCRNGRIIPSPVFERILNFNSPDLKFIKPMDIAPTPAQMKSGKVGMDDLCPCGSGMKFRECCLIDKNKKPIKKRYLAVDFDGTIVTHEYPEIGKDIGAFDVLARVQDLGVLLILYTIRSGNQLAEAVSFCEKMGLKFYAVNSNPDQLSWSGSSKVYAHIYIDDAAIGCPLKFNVSLSKRPYADWGKIKELLKLKFELLDIV